MASASVSVLKHWREAATLILISPFVSRNRPSLSYVLANATDKSHQDDKKNRVGQLDLAEEKENLDVEDYSVLMLQRSRKSKFMPDLYVYPGGVAVDNDFSTDWISLFRKVSDSFQNSLFSKLTQGSSVAAPMFQRQRESDHFLIPPELAFRICAIRETFEESGVLIAKPVSQINDISQSLSKNWTFSPSSGFSDIKEMLKWREIVNKNPNEFLRMCHELNVIPAVWTLHEWSNWLTPVAAIESGRRYDTVFYICCLDHKPDALEDAGETVDSLWSQPSNFLSSYFQQKIVLAPPQVYEFSRMLHFQSHLSLMNFSTQREPQRVERFLPVIYTCKDFNLSLLPGDDLYPEDPENTPYQQSDHTLEELCKEHTHHHRLCFDKTTDAKGLRRPFWLQCNISAGRGHVGPVTGFEKKFDMKSNL